MTDTTQTPAAEAQTLAAVERFVGIDECEEITGLSRTTIWRLEKEGQFPPKVRISKNRKAHPLSWIRKWVADRIAESQPADDGEEAA